MKINRISESIGLISDEISSRAIEAFEKTSEKQSGISAEKPRVIREEKSRKTPFVIALAGLCAAAAVAVPFAMNKIGKNEIVAHESISGAAESVYDETVELKLRDNIILQMNLPQTAPSELPAVKLTLKQWDREETKKLFFGGKKITLEKDFDSDYYPNQKLYNCATDDEIVILEPGRFSYWNKAALGGEFKYGSVYGYRCDDCTLIDDNYESDKELSVYSKADAKKLADEMIDKIGIKNLGEPKIIAVTADAANKILERYSEWIPGGGKEKDTAVPFTYTPWTENEEAYILRYPQVFENTELTMNGVPYIRLDGGNGVTHDSGVVVYVAKDKVLRLDANQIYDGSYEKGENVSVNCGAQQALDVFKDYLSYQNWEKTVKYYNCKLTYVPYNSSNDALTVWYKPAWEFAGYRMPVESWDEGLDRTLQTGQEYQYVYADTGRIHVTNMGDDVKIPEGSSIGAKVDRLKLTFNGDEISAVPDEINANVNYFTLKFDKSKGDTFAIVTNDDGTFKTFAGNNMSEEEILRECPDGVFGMMWTYKDDGEQWKVILGFEDFDMARNGVSLFRDGTTICYQFWVSNDKSIASEIHSRIKPGTGGYLEIKDNGNGTFSAYMDITQ